MQVVIIGAGHAAAQCVLNLKRENFGGSIIVIGDEPYLPYMRPPLSKAFLQGQQTVEQLLIKPQSFYDDNNVKHIQAIVKNIDKNQQTVLLDSGEVINFTKLIIATGAQIRRLDVPGANLQSIHYLKTIADAEAIKKKLADVKNVVVCGGGYIGLEVAASARQAGIDVTVLEMGERVMQRVVSSQTSDYFTDLHKQQGVQIHCKRAVSHFSGDQVVQSVHCSDGSEYKTDLVIIGVGVIPEVSLAKAAELDTDNGVVVNEYCQTSDANIYAMGDCANHYNTIYAKRLRLECVQNANGQAKTVAAHICSKDIAYDEVPWFWSDQYDQKLQIAGLLEGHDEIVIRGDINSSAGYSVLALKDKVLIAVEAVKRPKDFMHGKALIAKKTKLNSNDLKDITVELNAVS